MEETKKCSACSGPACANCDGCGSCGSCKCEATGEGDADAGGSEAAAE